MTHLEKLSRGDQKKFTVPKTDDKLARKFYELRY